MLSRSAPVVAFIITLAIARAALAVDVVTLADLRAAIEGAQPGTTIHLAKGIYVLESAIGTKAAGTVDKPIIVTADAAVNARLDFSSNEGLVIGHAYWTVEHVWINGTCTGCTAFGVHVLPGADHLTVSSVRVTNFATGIKSERTATTEVSDITLQGNEFFNDPAKLAAGGIPIDIVGGKRLHLINNYLHDYSGTGGHAALSLRGGAADAVIEQNLIAGAKTRAASGTAIGLSFGGSGTAADNCAADNRAATSCNCEVSAGMVRNNIVAHSGGAGLHTNRACGTKIQNNTVYDTTPGFVLETAGPTGMLDVRFNIFSGAVMGGAAAMNLANVSAATYKMTYLDPDNLDFYQGPNDAAVNDLSAGNPDVPLDYTGLKRKATNDWGAMELPTTIHTWPWAGAAMIGAGTGPANLIPAGNIDAGAGSDTGVAGSGGMNGTDAPIVGNGSGGAGAGGTGGGGTGGASVGTGGTSGGGGVAPVSASSGGGCATATAPNPAASTVMLMMVLGCAHLFARHRKRHSKRQRESRFDRAGGVNF